MKKAIQHVKDCAGCVSNPEELQKIYKDFILILTNVMSRLYVPSRIRRDFIDRAYDNVSNGKTIQELIIVMQGVCAEADAIITDQLCKRQNKYIQNTLRIIEEEYKDVNLSLQNIASELNINYSYLSTLFNDYVGTNFSNYLNSYRLKKAKELVITNPKLVKEVWEMTGFTSPRAFYNAFKKHTGKTLTQWLYEKQDFS